MDDNEEDVFATSIIDRTQMNKIKKAFLGKRIVGAPESAMQVLSIWLMKKAGK